MWWKRFCIAANVFMASAKFLCNNSDVCQCSGRFIFTWQFCNTEDIFIMPQNGKNTAA